MLHPPAPTVSKAVAKFTVPDWGWRTGTTTLCRSQLYPPVRDYVFGYRLLNRYVKTTWTVFPLARIFASCLLWKQRKYINSLEVNLTILSLFRIFQWADLIFTWIFEFFVKMLGKFLSNNYKQQRNLHKSLAVSWNFFLRKSSEELSPPALMHV